MCMTKGVNQNGERLVKARIENENKTGWKKCPKNDAIRVFFSLYLSLLLLQRVCVLCVRELIQIIGVRLMKRRMMVKCFMGASLIAIYEQNLSKVIASRYLDSIYFTIVMQFQRKIT